MQLPNLSKYQNFDEFLQRNNVEVMSFQDGVIARFKYTLRYKEFPYRVTETRFKQVIGENYIDLTKKLKKEIKRLYRVPWTFLFGTLMSAGMFYAGLINYETILIIFGVVLGVLSIYFVITNFIQFLHARAILKSQSIITQDYVRTGLSGLHSLFRDVIVEIEKEQAIKEKMVDSDSP